MTAIDISTKYPPVRNYIGGRFVEGNGTAFVDVTNPADGSVISRVPLSAAPDVDRAVQAAKKAFPAWSGLPIKERVQVFFRYKTLLENNIDELAALITEENGKIDGEARVEVLCDHPDIEGITFVGSTRVAKIVYRRGTANLKRVLALGGAKNHLIVMPDAEPEMTSSNVVASMSGCAGQRCMAASVMMAVGNTDHIIQRMIAITRGLKIGPVISKEAKQRIEGYITEAEKAGAKVLVDGRGKEGPGFWIGPTLIDYVTPEMRIAQEEVFGPVMVVIRTKDVDEALRVQKRSRYGNAASVFTESGGVARYVMENASAGMVGVNVGVPVPREPFSFGGWNESKFGVGDITGRGSIEFWTKSKKMTTKWNKEAGVNWMS